MEILGERPDWQRRAACRGVGPELAYPPRGGGATSFIVTYCHYCAVRIDCLEYALERADEPGIWGGAGERERHRIRRARRRAAAAADAADAA